MSLSEMYKEDQDRWKESKEDYRKSFGETIKPFTDELEKSQAKYKHINEQFFKAIVGASDENN